MNSTNVSSCRRAALMLGVLLAAGAARADEPAADPEQRTTGLPPIGDWKFNFDAGAGAFGFSNSLYTNPKADPSGNLSDNWLESYIKPAISLDSVREAGDAFFAKLSAVGERTFSAPPTLVGDSASSLLVEDAYVGWRSGTMLKAGDDALEFTLGRAPYHIGHGFLLWDGAANGGSRGGYWSAPRKAWKYAVTGSFKADDNTVEVFYLVRDEIPGSDSGTSLWGMNYERTIGTSTTLGATYLNTRSHTLALRDGMNVYNARAYTSPFSALPDVAFELEYAYEEKGSVLSSTAWTAQVSYTLSDVVWKPRLSYRYASFEGDNPKTAKSEAFDSLFPGFSDWGTWWQGEIAGEYFLANSNLISDQLRVHLTPNDAVSGGVIAYEFHAYKAASIAPGVTSDDIGAELDGYVDWKINQNFTASFVTAYAEPHRALEQGFGRTRPFTYGMVYLAYSY